MENKITIDFTVEELKERIINYYGIDEEDFDINDFDEQQIKIALLEG